MSGRTADMKVRVYTNATIRTGEMGAEPAEALAVVAGKILAIGSADEVLAQAGSGVEIIDLGGRAVIPGLADVHTHVAGHALEEKCVEIRDTCDPEVDSIEEIKRRMGAAAELTPQDEWIIGIGAMRQNTRLVEGRWPTRDDLDEVVPNHPAYITFGAHITVANSRALELGGIDVSTPDPVAGRIEHDQVTGEPNGVLAESAKKTILRNLRDDYGFEGLVDALELALIRCASSGITTIHDMITEPEQVRAYQTLYEQGRLPIRVALLIRVIEANFDHTLLPSLGLYAGFGDDKLWFGGAKISIDGGTSSRSAAFSTPLPGQSIDAANSIIRVPPDELNTVVAFYQQAGIRLCIHTIGDAAVDYALDAFEQARSGGSGLRHRLEHFGNYLVTQERLDRCKALGLTPVPNPSFVEHLGDDHWEMLGGEGSAWAEDAYPFRLLVDEGFHIAGGSDGPGPFRCDGLQGLRLMIERLTRRGQRFPSKGDITLEEALYAQTEAAAWLGYQEDTAGALVVGNNADFVVLDCDDLFDCDAEQLRNLSVLQTVVAGNVAYSPARLLASGVKA